MRFFFDRRENFELHTKPPKPTTKKTKGPDKRKVFLTTLLYSDDISLLPPECPFPQLALARCTPHCYFSIWEHPFAFVTERIQFATHVGKCFDDHLYFA